MRKQYPPNWVYGLFIHYTHREGTARTSCPQLPPRAAILWFAASMLHLHVLFDCVRSILGYVAMVQLHMDFSFAPQNLQTKLC